jgi:serine/threonine protein kinase, bacterial
MSLRSRLPSALHRMHAFRKACRTDGQGGALSDSQWRFGDRYEVLDGIGSGLSGSVWRARDVRTGTECALKALRPELVQDAAAVSRFYAVLSAISGLGHRNIVGVDEVVARDGQLALVSPLVRGYSLLTMLTRNGPMPPAVAAQIMAQLCDALAAAHAVGVAHGDVKPANVIIEAVEDGFPTVHLSDFGVAWLLNAAPTGGLTVPSPEYLAPELAPGEPATPASDVYAVGIVLYEVLSGRPPFTGPDPATVAGLHRGAQPASIPGLPNPLWLPIAACLDKNPQHRPSASDLAALLRDVGPLSDPVPLPSLPRTQDGDEPTRMLELGGLELGGPELEALGLGGLELGRPELPAPMPMAVPVPDIPTAVLDSALIDRALSNAALAMTSGAMVESGAVAPARPPAEHGANSRRAGRRRRSYKAELIVAAAVVVLCGIVAALVNNSGHRVPPGGPAKIVAAPAPTATPAGISLSPAPNGSSSASASPSGSPSASPSPSSATSSPTVTTSSPTTVVTTAQGQITINWQCKTDVANNVGIRKTSCIGVGSDHQLYARGSFDGPQNSLSDIKVSLIEANGGATIATTSSGCNGSPCSLTTGPFSPSAGMYYVMAGVDSSMHNEMSPTISYP